MAQNQKISIFEIEKISTVVGLTGAIALAVSIIYDWSYFFYLGLSYKEIPASLADHVRDTIVWLPKVTLSAFGVFIIELFNRRVEQGMTEEEIIASSPMPRFTKAIRNSPTYFFIAGAIFIPVATFYWGIVLPLEAYMISSIILWFVFQSWLFGHPRIIERTPYKFYVLTKWLPVLMLWLGFQGAISARTDLVMPTVLSNLKLSDGNVISGVQLKTFERAILIKIVNSDKYSIVPWSSISEIVLSKTENKTNNRGSTESSE